jgi:hypothetical protein
VQHAIGAVARQGILAARAAARAAAADYWSKVNGLAPALRSGESYEEAARAAGIADRLARRWDVYRQAAVVDGASSDKAQRLASDAIVGSIDRIATTDTYDAFAGETSRLDDMAALGGYRVIEVWNATLDKRTCAACAERDGDSVERPERFHPEPPMHPLCRCYLSSYVVAT